VKKLLVAGAGLIGSRHVRTIMAHPDCALVGIVDPDPKARADANADVPGFDSIDAVDVAADGIIIATPTDLHEANAQDAARRGWDMLIEKPVAATLDQADRIIAATTHAGVATLVGHHRRYHASVQTLRARIRDGAIGRPLVASLLWAMRKPDAYFTGTWRDGAAGSPVMINLVHDIDLLRFVLGEVRTVAGLGASPQRGAQRVESGVAALGFANGCTASIVFADTTPTPWGFEAATGENPNIAATGQDMLWIAGSAGAISFPSLTLWSGAADWSETPQARMQSAPTAVPLEQQLSHFCEVMDRRAKPLISAADGRETLAVTLRVEAAVKVAPGAA